MRAKVNICRPCAAKLNAIQQSQGEQAMIRAMGSTLCKDCRRAVNRKGGYPDNASLVFEKIQRN